VAIVTTLGSTGAQSYLSAAEVAALLTGSEAARWGELTSAQQEAALIDMAQDTIGLPWAGRRLHPAQPLPLPTDATCKTMSIYPTDAYPAEEEGEYGLEADELSYSYRDWVSGEIVYGSIVSVASNDADGDYGAACRVVAHDRVGGRVTVDGVEFNGYPVSRQHWLIWPLPTNLRRALAIQAYQRGCGDLNQNAADAAHRGLTSLGGGPGTIGEVKHVGPRAEWDVRAWRMLRPYLRKSVETGRG